MAAPELLRMLPELVAQGFITTDQADRIRRHYGKEVGPTVVHAPPQAAAPHATGTAGNRLQLLLGALGGILIGLGIVLVVAHNWDELPRVARTMLAFAPVVAGQAVVWYGLRRHPAQAGWVEGGALFLSAAVAACIALISQLYHLGGSLDSYLLLVSLLILGLCYVPGSIATGWAYLAMIGWYGGLIRVEDDAMPWLWIALLAAYLPAGLRSLRDSQRSVTSAWTGTLLGISILVGAHYFVEDIRKAHLIGAASLASAYTLAPWLVGATAGARAVRRVGQLVLLYLLFMLGSVNLFGMWSPSWGGHAREWIQPTLLLMLAAGAYAWASRTRKPFQGGPLPEGAAIIAILVGITTVAPWVSALLANLLMLALGIWYVRDGGHVGSLRRMNLGLLLVAIPILWRFLEVDLSFVWRGLAFIAIGVAFLVLNMRMIKARKKA